jgi:hypothetical protein
VGASALEQFNQMAPQGAVLIIFHFFALRFWLRIRVTHQLKVFAGN